MFLNFADIFVRSLRLHMLNTTGLLGLVLEKGWVVLEVLIFFQEAKISVVGPNNLRYVLLNVSPSFY